MRRIEAVTGEAADALMRANASGVLERAAGSGRRPDAGAAAERVEELKARIRELERRLQAGATAGGARPRPADAGHGRARRRTARAWSRLRRRVRVAWTS